MTAEESPERTRWMVKVEASESLPEADEPRVLGDDAESNVSTEGLSGMIRDLLAEASAGVGEETSSAECTLELTGSVSTTVGGEGGLKLYFLTLGGKAERESANTLKLTIKATLRK